MSKHNELGVRGEITALEFLLQKGYSILEINWRFNHAEIDIIARVNNTIVFTEVKTRSSDYFGFPEQAVDNSKQKRMALAAEEYMEQHNIEMNLRFDIISILIDPSEKISIEHIEDAFFPYEL